MDKFLKTYNLPRLTPKPVLLLKEDTAPREKDTVTLTADMAFCEQGGYEVRAGGGH